ncbi:hypothetical protein QJS04_geneDACA004062 [Acorus gramineus]|uniref:Bifunctional lysine-specific demethylase and histidyl-hydroxylase n=1 Tax=Acorus gramineus TaxID=55184 RepID=A0AAV9BIT1_ACOGR|nr:hypothetical protein QJS04_geneDACA004062 [Acorus gramineus]
MRSNAVDSTEKGISNSRIGFVKDDVLSNVVLHTAVILINTCDEVFLRKIPGELSLNFLHLLKESWGRMHSWPTPWKCHEKQSSTFSNMRANDLAETIFRLSMNQVPHAICAVDVARRSIFGSTELEFENFIINHWEESPILLTKVSKNLEGDNIIFSLLADVFKSSTIGTLLNSILRGLVSCPPINSDEMDILNFLKKVRDELGSPMLYEQDIRILKTVRSTSMSTHGPLKTEVHYPMKSMNSRNMERPEFTGIDLVRQCKKAYHEGYTVALRGVEFRWEEVAMITDRLAMLFGQPSVGANLYLTPARSQGLVRHFDDHCVFICQLIGQKQWTVLPRGAGFLPRLYEPTCNLHCSESDGNIAEGKHFLLGEGDILYIPRGYPHEAHTLNNVDKSCIDETTELSLHLTLGIEVEPPFEWEGFAHIALHSWNLTQRRVTFNHLDSASQILSEDIVYLLHVAIRLIGNRNPVFRKACLVAASSLPSQSEGDNHIHAHALNQRTIFAHIINQIDAHSSFLEAFGTVKVAVYEKNDDSLQWMGWLHHLPQEEERIDFNDPLRFFEDLVLSYEGHINEACSAFMHVKSSFCRDVRFEDTRSSFERLLEKYRKTRKQFMKDALWFGMLGEDIWVCFYSMIIDVVDDLLFISASMISFCTHYFSVSFHQFCNLDKKIMSSSIHLLYTIEDSHFCLGKSISVSDLSLDFFRHRFHCHHQDPPASYL